MENQENVVKYYDNLLGLLFISPDCKDDQCFHAFSFNKEVLENMILKDIPLEQQNYYSIKKIKVFKILTNPVINLNTFILVENQIYNENNTLYGFNYINYDKEIVEQVILMDNNLIKDLKKIEIVVNNGISFNPIKINTFYEESILNA